MSASEILCGRSEDGYLVRVVRRGSMHESPAFRAFVKQCLKRREAVVTVDLSECGYLDSTFLGGLIWLSKFAGEGPRLKFVANPEKRRQLFSYSLLDRQFYFVDAAPPATSEFTSMPTEAVDADELGHHVMQCHRNLAELGGPEAEKFASVADILSRELRN